MPLIWWECYQEHWECYQHFQTDTEQFLECSSEVIACWWTFPESYHSLEVPNIPQTFPTCPTFPQQIMVAICYKSGQWWSVGLVMQYLWTLLYGQLQQSSCPIFWALLGMQWKHAIVQVNITKFGKLTSKHKIWTVIDDIFWTVCYYKLYTTSVLFWAFCHFELYLLIFINK